MRKTGQKPVRFGEEENLQNQLMRQGSIRQTQAPITAKQGQSVTGSVTLTKEEFNSMMTSFDPTKIDDSSFKIIASVYNMLQDKNTMPFTIDELLKIAIEKKSLILLGFAIRFSGNTIYIDNNDIKENPIYYIVNKYKPSGEEFMYYAIAILIKSGLYKLDLPIKSGDQTNIESYLKQNDITLTENEFKYITSDLYYEALFYLDDVKLVSIITKLYGSKKDKDLDLLYSILFRTIIYFDNKTLKNLPPMTIENYINMKRLLLETTFTHYNDVAFKYFLKYETPNTILINRILIWLINNKSTEPINKAIYDKVFNMLIYSLTFGDYVLDEYQKILINKLDPTRKDKLKNAGWNFVCSNEFDGSYVPTNIRLLDKNLGFNSDDSLKKI